MRPFRRNRESRTSVEPFASSAPAPEPWPFVSADWLAWPTLASRGGDIKTAGVFYYQDAFRRILARHGALVMRELRIELLGEYAGAVHAYAGGDLIGSIPHGQAEAFRAVVETLNAAGTPATCRAQLELDGEYFDVWLSARPEPCSDDGPFLPPTGSCRVILDAGEAERLDASLGSNAKRKRVVVLGALREAYDGWEVRVEDRRLGMLAENPHPAIGDARAAGFPLTCWTRILREPEKPLRVMADIPIARET